MPNYKYWRGSAEGALAFGDKLVVIIRPAFYTMRNELVIWRECWRYIIANMSYYGDFVCNIIYQASAIKYKCLEISGCSM